MLCTVGFLMAEAYVHAVWWLAAVFLVHFHPWVSPFLPRGWVFDLSARLGDMGNIGVDVFFVLSGVLIHGAILRRPQPFPDFFRRRLQRLYPTFLVVFVPVLLIELARGAPTLSGGPGPVVNLIGNLTLLAGFLPIDPLIVVAWTLSWEIVFYVTLPFLFWAGRLRTRSPGVRLAIIGVVWVGMSVSGALQSAGNARIHALHAKAAPARPADRGGHSCRSEPRSRPWRRSEPTCGARLPDTSTPRGSTIRRAPGRCGDASGCTSSPYRSWWPARWRRGGWFQPRSPDP